MMLSRLLDVVVVVVFFFHDYGMQLFFLGQNLVKGLYFCAQVSAKDQGVKFISIALKSIPTWYQLRLMVNLF